VFILKSRMNVGILMY